LPAESTALVKIWYVPFGIRFGRRSTQRFVPVADRKRGVLHVLLRLSFAFRVRYMQCFPCLSAIETETSATELPLQPVSTAVPRSTWLREAVRALVRTRVRGRLVSVHAAGLVWAGAPASGAGAAGAVGSAGAAGVVPVGGWDGGGSSVANAVPPETDIQAITARMGM
jgi:hypothetical protein